MDTKPTWFAMLVLLQWLSERYYCYLDDRIYHSLDLHEMSALGRIYPVDLRVLTCIPFRDASIGIIATGIVFVVLRRTFLLWLANPTMTPQDQHTGKH
jgi:hypothetical protein